MAKCKNNFDNLCDRELLEQILRTLQDSSTVLAGEKSHQRLYDNKALMDLLHIKDKYLKKLREDKYLKKLRDNGYLGYSREGDKYWYSQKDVDDFLNRFHYDAFATNPLCPIWEGGDL